MFVPPQIEEWLNLLHQIQLIPTHFDREPEKPDQNKQYDDVTKRQWDFPGQVQ